MKWRKLGCIYRPDGSRPWARSHAANPVAEHVEGDLFRVYCSTRDENNRSSVTFVEIDIRNPTRILREAEAPVLVPGATDSFDSHGISIGCIVARGERRLLYYMGWHLTAAQPWRNTLGLAVSEAPGQPFVKHNANPLIDVSEADPYTMSYPWVTVENGAFRMWYGSTIAWGATQEDMTHVIKYATSADGIQWVLSEGAAVPFKPSDEHILCRPCVRRAGGLYRMWFCARGERYRIGYAESEDGVRWTRRDDKETIDVSESGWDSQMIEYPFVFGHGGERYMLYCGNGYGETGFGLAVLESE